MAQYRPNSAELDFPMQGEVHLKARGAMAAARILECAAWLEQRCREVTREASPGLSNAAAPRGEGHPRSRTIQARRLCVLCASEGDHPGIEQPRRDLEAALDSRDVDLRLDEQHLGRNFLAFMKEFSTTGLYYLVIHSEPYWKSQYCMWELSQIYHAFVNQQASMRERVIPVRVDYRLNQHDTVRELQKILAGSSGF